MGNILESWNLMGNLMMVMMTTVNLMVPIKVKTVIVMMMESDNVVVRKREKAMVTMNPSPCLYSLGMDLRQADAFGKLHLHIWQHS